MRGKEGRKEVGGRDQGMGEGWKEEGNARKKDTKEVKGEGIKGGRKDRKEGRQN